MIHGRWFILHFYMSHGYKNVTTWCHVTVMWHWWMGIDENNRVVQSGTNSKFTCNLSSEHWPYFYQYQHSETWITLNESDCISRNNTLSGAILIAHDKMQASTASLNIGGVAH